MPVYSCVPSCPKFGKRFFSQRFFSNKKDINEIHTITHLEIHNSIQNFNDLFLDRCLREARTWSQSKRVPSRCTRLWTQQTQHFREKFSLNKSLLMNPLCKAVIRSHWIFQHCVFTGLFIERSLASLVHAFKSQLYYSAVLGRSYFPDSRGVWNKQISNWVPISVEVRHFFLGTLRILQQLLPARAPEFVSRRHRVMTVSWVLSSRG